MRVTTILGASLLALSLGTASAGDDETDFVSLFDGESLSGWKSTTENPDSFSVKDGILIVKGGRAHLFYDGPVNDGDFKNFELQAKVRTTPGSNSGIYFHTSYQAEGWPDIGHEAQVNSTNGDPRKTGSLYAIADVYAPGDSEEPFVVRFEGQDIQAWAPSAPSTDGEWFDYTVIVIDNTVELKVDGKTTIKWTEPEDWPDQGRQIDHGTFALQAHDPDSEIHYKDIRVRVLD
ncbi:3-keto-disaccharide hydrolase [Parvularcula marina]|uniref:DUF1080 domain-containing protein n=1 Tax=Parvularcula marina TaxID=2292771 RepID=A0A371RLY5_9PROT|nr:DUF1080 domain-containing protein [Parvularcula marina]RFB06470.1 DUF1080 domain-containing protein [Parvularcula marina]